MGLYKGGGAYIRAAYTWAAYACTIFCVSNKQVSHKQENKNRSLLYIKTMSMLNNIVGYWAYIRGEGGLYSGGLPYLLL